MCKAVPAELFGFLKVSEPIFGRLPPYRHEPCVPDLC